MASVNKVTLVGHLGADPEIRYMPSGDAIANFRLATTDRYKDKATGEMRESTEWHRCAAFGRTAEVCGEYVKKGSQVFVEGKIQTRKWTDQSGVEKYTTEIRVNELQMLGSRSAVRSDNEGSGGYSSGYSRTSEERAQTHRTAQRTSPTSRVPTDEFSDDIPF